jgi:hypothetical protein
MQQITAKCKAVGKYKDKFNSTGLLLEWNGDTWVDLPGQLNWKDYKEKTLTLEVQQNDKGYWSGNLANTFSGGSQSPQNAPQQPSNGDRDDHIQFAQALNLAVSEYVHGKIDQPHIHVKTKEYYEILKTRNFPAIMSSESSVF